MQSPCHHVGVSHLQCCDYVTEKLPLGDIIALPLDLQSTTVDSKAWGNGCISGENQHGCVAYRRAAFRSCPSFSCSDCGEVEKHSLAVPHNCLLQTVMFASLNISYACLLGSFMVLYAMDN